MKILLLLYLSLFSGMLLANTTSEDNQSRYAQSHPDDPLEGLNRVVFEFDKVLDEYILHPITHIYIETTPQILQVSVDNFFSNLTDIPTFGNQLLQLKLNDSIVTLTRIVLNTTLGMAGIADVASAENMQKKDEDFGQTLGHYGVPSGPFLVLPFLGPSSLRDVTKYPVDNKMKVNLKQSDSEAKVTLTANVLNTSANFINITDIVYHNEDPYVKMRSYYLQNREYKLNNDGLSASDIDF